MLYVELIICSRSRIFRALHFRSCIFQFFQSHIFSAPASKREICEDSRRLLHVVARILKSAACKIFLCHWLFVTLNTLRVEASVQCHVKHRWNSASVTLSAVISIFPPRTMSHHPKIEARHQYVMWYTFDNRRCMTCMPASYSELIAILSVRMLCQCRVRAYSRGGQCLKQLNCMTIDRAV